MKDLPDNEQEPTRPDPDEVLAAITTLMDASPSDVFSLFVPKPAKDLSEEDL